MLNKGDTIGIIALSGECDKVKVQEAKLNFEKLGYKVKLSKNIYDEYRYLAGADNDKISQLHEFFIDDEIKLILCARGGYGGIRLINNIDYNLIKMNPKPFCGYSDVTSLLIMINKNSEIITYHSPMACTDFIGNDLNTFSIKEFFNAINKNKIEISGTIIYKEGQTQGIIWGGNLSTVVSLCGQDFIPEKDFIFFTEDLNEPVYKIDKMFQQLFNISKFKNYCKGIVLGDFLGIDNNLWLEEYFVELGNILNIPIIGGFKITHSIEKVTIPIGKMAFLDKKNLTII